ncbi:MAG: helix-turn-helix transcriptional regulator [Coriobacteriia bacterium]
MPDAAERLVNLALLLSSTRRHVTAEQCRAAGLGYPADQDNVAFLRMFERDKDALRAAGLVIEVALDPDTGTEAYRLDAEATYARPVDLTAEELSALRAVAAAFADDAAFPFREDLMLALGKLGTAGHQGPVATTAAAGSDVAQRMPEVQALAEAVRLRKSVTFDYANTRGDQRRRSVDPYGLFLREGRWYLAGLDTGIAELRTFAIDRLSSLDVNPRRPRTPDFERPQGFDVRQQERLPFQYGPTVTPARIRFEPGSAWRAAGLSRGHGLIDDLPDGSRLWTVDFSDLEVLASWLLTEGPGLHAVDPPELIATLAIRLKEVLAAHG